MSGIEVTKRVAKFDRISAFLKSAAVCKCCRKFQLLE